MSHCHLADRLPYVTLVAHELSVLHMRRATFSSHPLETSIDTHIVAFCYLKMNATKQF